MSIHPPPPSRRPLISTNNCRLCNRPLSRMDIEVLGNDECSSCRSSEDLESEPLKPCGCNHTQLCCECDDSEPLPSPED